MTAARSIQGIVEGDSNPDVFIPRMIEFYKQGRTHRAQTSVLRTVRRTGEDHNRHTAETPRD